VPRRQMRVAEQRLQDHPQVQAVELQLECLVLHLLLVEQPMPVRLPVVVLEVVRKVRLLACLHLMRAPAVQRVLEAPARVYLQLHLPPPHHPTVRLVLHHPTVRLVLHHPVVRLALHHPVVRLVLLLRLAVLLLTLHLVLRQVVVPQLVEVVVHLPHPVVVQRRMPLPARPATSTKIC